MNEAINLQIIVSAADQASGVLGSIGSSFGELASSASESLAAIVTALAGYEAAVLTAAADTQASTEILNTTITDSLDVVNNAAQGNGSLASEMDDLKAKMAVTSAEIDKYQTTTKGSTAAMDENQARVQQLQITYNQYQAQLQVLQGRMSDLSVGSDSIKNSFQTAIDAGIGLGFTVDQTTNALNVLQPIMGSQLALTALTAAENLSRASNGQLDLATASRQLGQAMETGSGRALAQYGVVVKDGIGGTDLLQAVMASTKDQASNYADTLNGKLAVAWANINKLMGDVGNAQIPFFTNLVSGFSELVSAIDGVVSNTPGAQKKLEDFLNSIGISQPVIDQFKEEWSLIAQIWEDQLEPNLELAWNAFKPYLPFLEQLAVLLAGSLVVGLEEVVSGFVALNTIVTTLVTFFISTMKPAFDEVVAGLQDISKWVNTVIGDISRLFSAGSSGGGGVLGGIGNVISGSISAIGNALHLASGGIVTQPTFALIGEAGPEAVVPLNGAGIGGGSFGSGAININIGSIQGTDRNTAISFANQVAKVINQQLKLKNYS